MASGLALLYEIQGFNDPAIQGTVIYGLGSILAMSRRKWLHVAGAILVGAGYFLAVGLGDPKLGLAVALAPGLLSLALLEGPVRGLGLAVALGGFLGGPLGAAAAALVSGLLAYLSRDNLGLPTVVAVASTVLSPLALGHITGWSVEVLLLTLAVLILASLRDTSGGYGRLLLVAALAAGASSAAFVSRGIAPVPVFAAVLGVASAVAAARRPRIAMAALALALIPASVVTAALPGDAGALEAGVWDYRVTGYTSIPVDEGFGAWLSTATMRATSILDSQCSDPLRTLILEARVPGRIVLPSLVESAMIYDFQTGSTATYAFEEPQPLPLDLARPVEVAYAVEDAEEGPRLQASIEVSELLIPWTLTGGTPISPVHALVRVNFSDPLVVEAGSARILVYEAVISSKRFLGGQGEAEETAMGMLFEGAVIGVYRGSASVAGHVISLPANASSGCLQLFEERIRLAEEDRDLALAISAYPSLEWLGQAPPGAVTGPESVVVEYNTTLGAAKCLMGPGHRYCSALAEARGLGLLVYDFRGVNVDVQGTPVPVEAVLAVRASGLTGVDALALAYTLTGKPGATVWASRYMDYLEDYTPQYTLVYLPLYNTALLAPFLALPPSLAGTLQRRRTRKKRPQESSPA